VEEVAALVAGPTEAPVAQEQARLRAVAMKVKAAQEEQAQACPGTSCRCHIPLIGTVRMLASDIVLGGVAVADSTVAAGDTGVMVAASFSSVNLTMEWSYSYDSWFVTISNSGSASIQVRTADGASYAS
jgi:hypothetical protein